MSTDYFTTKDGLLYMIGSGPEGEPRVAPEGYDVHEGLPDGFSFGVPPYPGARWHVANQEWVDTRTKDEKNAQQIMDVSDARRSTYPDLAELGDALYWQSKGDNTKMEAYLAACEAVKAQYPKVM